ncbi:LacI family DNA-binding transcriptional regulator [Rhodococcus sp. KBS0724]|uniref:LacI family DNA-binding transcriptional regulator n=1 Tax=Rhodococcus sp. KBS0724 TaxID=1179674 RepID=UPI00163D99D1|nr:LacI family DNA-binding transcriptional regulator [Rhodococcus sp. KBS0724]
MNGEDHTLKKPVTLRAVAQKAGVSIATVSKALNGLHVSAVNYARVHRAAESLGYTPNVGARGLRGARTMSIGVVINFDVHPGIELMTLIDKTVEDMERGGYGVLLATSRPGGTDVDSLLRRMFERRVDGLFYWNAQPAKSLMLYREAGIPVLAVAFRSPECSDLPLISADSRQAYTDLFSTLHDLGHRMVVDLSGEISSRGHEVGARARSIEYQRLDIGFEREDVRRLVRSIAGRPLGPTAVIAPYPTALQVLSVCDELDVVIPDELSLVSVMDSEATSLLRVPLSAMSMDYQSLGSAASQAMLDKLAGGEIRDIVLSEAVELIQRSSIGPAPRRP